MDGYKPFRRDMQRRGGGGGTLYFRECFDCPELHDGDEKFGCLWVRTRKKANKAAWWESGTDHPARTKRQTKHSTTEDDK